MSTSRPIMDMVRENNQTSMFYQCDSAMIKAHRAGNHETAESAARQLLIFGDLPLLIRARACMVLGCSTAPDFLSQAQEAVRIAELGRSRSTNPGAFEDQLVNDCHTVLREAREAAGDGSSVKVPGEQEEEEGVGGDLELVWERPDVAAARAAAAAEAAALAAMMLLPDGRKKKIRQFRAKADDPGVLQEYDQWGLIWVPLGTAGSPVAQADDDEMLLQREPRQSKADEDAEMLMAPDDVLNDMFDPNAGGDGDDGDGDDGEVFEGFD